MTEKVAKRSRLLRSKGERLWMKICGAITFILLIIQVIKDGHP